MGLRDRLKNRIGRLFGAMPEPVTPEPVTVLKPEPVKVEAVKPEPVKPEPVKAEPADKTPALRSVPDAEAPGTGAIRSGVDAPTRTSHLRPIFRTTDQALRVSVTNPDTDQTVTFTCEPGEYVLEAADRAGHELPSSCRNGGCLTCTGKLLEGSAEIMEDQYVLEADHLSRNFRLLCITAVTSDARFVSHQQEEI
jgi:ferredoxin